MIKKIFLCFCVFSVIFVFTACGDKTDENFTEYPDTIMEFAQESGDKSVVQVREVPEQVVTHEFILSWMDEMDQYKDVDIFLIKFKDKSEGVVAYPNLNMANYPVKISEDFKNTTEIDTTRMYYLKDGVLVRAEDDEIVAKK